MEGPQRGVVAGVERGGLPQCVLACQPGRAVSDLDVREARLAQAGGEVYPAQLNRRRFCGLGTLRRYLPCSCDSQNRHQSAVSGGG
jgi:hypothetical protein